MANEKKIKRLEKTFVYKRAYWESGSNETLSELLIEAHIDKNTVGSRVFDFEEGEIQGSMVNINKSNNNIELHITYYIDDSKASALNKNTDEENNSTSEADAPSGYNYLDKEVFVYINRNNLIICQPNQSYKILLSYIQQITKNNNINIRNIAKVDKISMIQSKGIKNIGYNSSQSNLNIDHIDNRLEILETDSRTRKIKKYIQNGTSLIIDNISRIYSEENGGDIDLNDYFNIDINISTKGKLMKSNRTISENINNLPDMPFDEDDDGFSLILQDGTKMKQSDVIISQKYDILPFGNSLNIDDVFNKLKIMYQHLNSDGTLLNDL